MKLKTNAKAAIVALALTTTRSIAKRVPHRALQPVLNCIGEVLSTGHVLHANEYIGPEWACPAGGYRFGLDQDGFLGAWDYDGITWHSGIRGEYLRMQKNGNLVLYDTDDNPRWASGCFGHGVELRNNGGMQIVEAVNDNDDIVWKIYFGGQESVCYPADDNYAPEVKCRGSILGPAVQLSVNEYICDRTGQQVRFGLNAQGKLALWHGNRAVWTPPHPNQYGDFLTMQRDGNLVLYKRGYGNNRVRSWNTGCHSAGAVLKLESLALTIEKRGGDILWMIDSFGNESGCNPPNVTPNEDCSLASFFGDTCQIQMIDFLNLNIVNLQVKDQGNGTFLVIDNVEGESCRSTGEPWEVSVVVRDNGNLTIDAGVPNVNCEGIQFF